MNQPTSIALTFHKTTFSVIEHTDGQIWLRGSQIATSLGMANAGQLSELYKRNIAEFTDSMTTLVNMPTPGGPQDIRIFSLRGAHLLGMLSRTDRAAEFRRWVLDVLERQAQPAAPELAGQLARIGAERDALRQALLAQNPQFRLIVKYHAIAGLTYTEKARLMGWKSSEAWRLQLVKLAALNLLDYRPDLRNPSQRMLDNLAAKRAAKVASHV